MNLTYMHPHINVTTNHVRSERVMLSHWEVLEHYHQRSLWRGVSNSGSEPRNICFKCFVVSWGVVLPITKTCSCSFPSCHELDQQSVWLLAKWYMPIHLRGVLQLSICSCLCDGLSKFWPRLSCWLKYSATCRWSSAQWRTKQGSSHPPVTGQQYLDYPFRTIHWQCVHWSNTRKAEEIPKSWTEEEEKHWQVPPSPISQWRKGLKKKGQLKKSLFY